MSEGTNKEAEKSGIVSSLAGKTADEIAKAINENPELADIVLSMSDSELYAAASPPQGDSGGNQTPEGPAGSQGQSGTEGAFTGQQQAQNQNQGPGEDEEITITIKKSLLGTYIKNREPEEAIVEMHKGITERDKFIEFLRNNKLPVLEQELELTKSQLASFKQEAARKATSQSADKSSEYDAASGDEDDLQLPEELDLFDPEQTQKVAKILRKQTEIIKKLSKGEFPQPQAAAQAGPQGPQPGMNPAELEAAQVRMLTKNPQFAQHFAGMQRDVLDIEKDFLNFCQDIALLNGHNGLITDQNGRIIPAIAEMVTLYQDSSNAAGDAIRARAQAAGIKLPDDMQYLNNVYNIKRIRNQFFKNGPAGLEPLPWEEAARIFTAQNPAQQPQPHQPPVQQYQQPFPGVSPGQPQGELSPEQQQYHRYQTAVQNRNQYSREPATNTGPDLTDIRNLPPQEFARLERKPYKDMTPVEQETWKRVLRELGGMSDEEIDSVCST